MYSLIFMMIGIDKKRHEVLQERIKRLEELPPCSRDGELRIKQQELEKQMQMLSGQFILYNTRMEQLTVIVESYTKLYNDTGSDVYRTLRKAMAARRRN